MRLQPVGFDGKVGQARSGPRARRDRQPCRRPAITLCGDDRRDRGTGMMLTPTRLATALAALMLAPPALADVIATAASPDGDIVVTVSLRSEEHTSELQSLMRISYAVFGLKKK